MEHYDVIVIGAGHAGLEAANICEKYSLKTALITKNKSDLGKLSCNPSIGGVGKTHIASHLKIMVFFYLILQNKIRTKILIVISLRLIIKHIK